jgi:hypothetical protein
MQRNPIQNLDLLFASVSPIEDISYPRFKRKLLKQKKVIEMDCREIQNGCHNLLATFSQLYQNYPNHGPKVTESTRNE